jgi:hypothetical protein
MLRIEDLNQYYGQSHTLWVSRDRLPSGQSQPNERPAGKPGRTIPTGTFRVRLVFWSAGRVEH